MEQGRQSPLYGVLQSNYGKAKPVAYELAAKTCNSCVGQADAWLC